MIAALRQASPEPLPCKICGAAAALYGVIDFNRSCEELRGVYLPLAGVPVYFRRCAACKFLFTDAFDDWSDAAFTRNVYNEDYPAIDPDYGEVRPAKSASEVIRLFGAHRAGLHVLDYGGGTGRLATLLKGGGFLAAESYDRFVPAYARLPEGAFELVTCIEVLEHMPDPNACIAEIAGRVAEPGIVLLETLVQPANFESQKMNWWYIGPRNGHISLFSREALALAWRRQGFNFASLTDSQHIAYRHLPDFARHLVQNAAALPLAP